MSDTELRLSFWRDGSTQAERLAAAALTLAGFEEIDPQAPLGGPDGTKDIVCIKGGISWIVGVYFPTKPVKFAAIKSKFAKDLLGVKAELDGFAFVTNQSLTPGQRVILSKIASATNKESEILHVERLRALLDSPSGYGTRIQFLKIPMNIEEQLAWFSEHGDRLTTAVAANTRELMRLGAMIQRLGVGQEDVVRTLAFVAAQTPDLLSTTSFTVDRVAPITQNLNLPLVLLFHRLVCFDLPSRSVGRLRQVDTRIGQPGGDTTAYIQPSP